MVVSSLRTIYREMAKFEELSKRETGLTPAETRQWKDTNEQLMSMIELDMKMRKLDDLAKLSDEELKAEYRKIVGEE